MEAQGGRLERIPDNAGLAFFGAITASVTHELNNVMAIVEQVAGLLDDLSASAQSGQSISPQKISSIYERISRQIERGVDIIRHLNKFAHSVDEPIKTFELNDLLVNFISLCQRFAGLKKVQLELINSGNNIALRNQPYLLEHAVFISLQEHLEATEPGGTITLSFESESSGVAIIISGAPASSLEVQTGKMNPLQALSKCLGGTCTFHHEAKRNIHKIIIPQINP